jgi:putative ABC transport system permease protein
MRAINRKLLRDLLHMRGQALAIAAVIGCGLAVFIGAQNTLWSLSSSRDAYYDRCRFAEVFASLSRAPISLADRIADLPGVAAVEHRIVEAVTLDLPDLDEPAVGKIISLPDRASPRVNDVHLLRGRLPEPGRGREILVEEAFMAANGLAPGDSLVAVINGRRQLLQIVGVALSPEYITTVQPGSIFPDDRRFGIFWMSRQGLEAAFNMAGAFNDIALSLMPGTQQEELIRRLDLLLAPYGGLGAFGRDSHLSHRFVDDELAQLRTMSIVPPSIFLGVAVFLLNIALRRLLTLQREQIASLKAFGYSNAELARHFLGLVALIVLAGVVLGWCLGSWMGWNMTLLYAEFYRFPDTLSQFDHRVYLAGAVLTLAAALLGVASGLAKAVSIPPAEAMRPEPPASYHPSLIERIGWHRLLAQVPRMILRELERHPMKAAMTSLGIAMACAILIVGNFGKDAIDYLMEFQFELSQRHDATVVFHDAVPQGAVGSLANMPGIVQIEPFRSVPVRLRNGARHRQTTITGLDDHRELYRLFDSKERPVALAEGGLVISSKLGDLLGLELGDPAIVEQLDGRRLTAEVRISAMVDDFAGTSAWMHRPDLHRLLREAPAISGAYLQLDPAHEAAAYRSLKSAPNVAAVSLQRVAMESFLESFGENILQMRLFNVAFACVIAFGVVYNSARVALSERGRELATLRVIGFTRLEVTAILLGELALLTCLAIPLGFLIGAGLCKLIAKALETELYRIPFVIDASTYGVAALVIALAAALSGLMVKRGVDRLDLIAVLKSRE